MVRVTIFAARDTARGIGARRKEARKMRGKAQERRNEARRTVRVEMFASSFE